MREMTWNEKAEEDRLIVRCMSCRKALRDAQEQLARARSAKKRAEAESEVAYWMKRIPVAEADLSKFQRGR